MEHKRKIHYVGKYNRPCTASGIIFYTDIDNYYYYLLQRNHKTGFYEDFGGKAEWSDKSPFQTAVREAVEETNASIFSGTYDTKSKYISAKKKEAWNYHHNYIKNKERCYLMYVPDSKYTLYLIYIPPELAVKLVPNRFGMFEFEENNRRDVFGVTEQRLIELICTGKCNPRLRNLPQFLRHIYKFYCVKTFLHLLILSGLL